MNATTHGQIEKEIEAMVEIAKEGFSFFAKDNDQACLDYVREIERHLQNIRDIAGIEDELTHINKIA